MVSLPYACACALLSRLPVQRIGCKRRTEKASLPYVYDDASSNTPSSKKVDHTYHIDESEWVLSSYRQRASPYASPVLAYHEIFLHSYRIDTVSLRECEYAFQSCYYLQKSDYIYDTHMVFPRYVTACAFADYSVAKRPFHRDGTQKASLHYVHVHDTCSPFYYENLCHRSDI